GSQYRSTLLDQSNNLDHSLTTRRRDGGGAAIAPRTESDGRFVATRDLGVREQVLRCLLRVGESHDRNHVGEMAMRILCRIDDSAKVQMALRVLKSQKAD